MVTKDLIELIQFADGLANNSNAISDLITRTTEFFNILSTALDNVKIALSYLYFFIPKAYFEPLITIFLLIMLAKCILAIVNLLYP